MENKTEIATACNLSPQTVDKVFNNLQTSLCTEYCVLMALKDSKSKPLTRDYLIDKIYMLKVELNIEP